MDPALAAFGLVLHSEGPREAPPDVYLWPENVHAWNLWQRVQTQWRDGLGGRTGLDYAGVNTCMQLLRVRPRQRQGLFAKLQVMERAALDVWAEKRNNEP